MRLPPMNTWRIRLLSCNIEIFSNGEPSTAMKSANRPPSSTPIRLPFAMNRAVTGVAQRNASAGGNPRSPTKISSATARHHRNPGRARLAQVLAGYGVFALDGGGSASQPSGLVWLGEVGDVALEG